MELLIRLTLLRLGHRWKISTLWPHRRDSKAFHQSFELSGSVVLESLVYLINSQVYMKELFSGYYRPEEHEFKEAWKSATFVLDANILLNMYRYPEETRNQFLAALRVIENRLWVPHQAALEFQRNRLAVISEQKKRFSDVSRVLSNSIKTMRSELDKLNLKKKHSSIQADGLVTSLDQQINKFLSGLKDLEEKQLSVEDRDVIRDNLDKIFGSKVGEPFSQDEIQKIYKEGATRFKNEIPPGYKDQNKETDNKNDAFSYGGINYERKYGDLVLWKQIISKAKKILLNL
jgi:PIN like domain